MSTDKEQDRGIIAQEIESINISISDSSIDLYDIVSYSTSGSGTITISSSDYIFDNPTRDELNLVIERLEKLEKAFLEEAEVRSKHPAVSKAYDEYKMLLALAKSHID